MFDFQYFSLKFIKTLNMKIRKKILYFSTALLGLSLIIVSFSPYQKGVIQKSIVINASVEQLFEYLGNSSNASEWSSFVSHIAPLNPLIAADGTVGSVRRCYKNEDERGEKWDEEILIAEPNKRRQLSIFNLQNFPINSDNLRTEQIYERLDSQQCRITFRLFLTEKARISDHAKMYLASFRIANIFQRNIENIKELNTQKKAP
jgi:hypothetical protein